MLLTEKQFISLANENRIKIKAPMRPIHNYGFMCLTCSSDEPKNVICNVEPKSIFKDSYYKLYLTAKDKKYGRDEYYLGDLLRLIDAGQIECIITI